MSNSGVTSHCITASARGLVLSLGLHSECCPSPHATIKCDTTERHSVRIITRGYGGVKYCLNRTRLFWKRLAGTQAEVRAVPVSVVNAGKSLKAALKSFIKGLGSEFFGEGGDLAHSVFTCQPCERLTLSRITSLVSCPTAHPRMPLLLRVAAVITVFYSVCKIKYAARLKQSKMRVKCQPKC